MAVICGLFMNGVPYRRVSHWCNGKSLSGDGSYTGEMMLCLGYVEAWREVISQIYMESVYCYISVPHIMGIHTEPLVAQLYCTLAYADNQLNW